MKIQTEIMIVASMHGYHKDHPTYSYGILYQLIANFKPDFVGVELRPEDIGAEKSYLQQYYPQEMIALSEQYGERAFGFDWYGDDVVGQAIPDNYAEHDEHLRLRKQLEQDDLIHNDELDMLEKEMLEILQSATPATLNDGRYDAIVRKRGHIFETMFKDSQYEPLMRYNRQRNQKINDNITQWLKQHPGKRIALVTGADHRTHIVEHIKKQFGNQVEMMSVLDPEPGRLLYMG